MILTQPSIIHQNQLRDLERRRNSKRREMFDAQDAIDQQPEDLIGKIEKQLKHRREIQRVPRGRVGGWHQCWIRPPQGGHCCRGTAESCQGGVHGWRPSSGGGSWRAASSSSAIHWRRVEAGRSRRGCAVAASRTSLPSDSSTRTRGLSKRSSPSFLRNSGGRVMVPRLLTGSIFFMQ